MGLLEVVCWHLLLRQSAHHFLCVQYSDYLRIKTGDDSGLEEKVARGEHLMGCGHRVYRTRDPRAEALSDVFRRLAAESPEVHRAEMIERSALAVLSA